LTKTNKRIVLALFTCSQWWSSEGPNGHGLLSLGTTRKLHSEEHRTECLSNIDCDLAWLESRSKPPGLISSGEQDEIEHDIARLTDLRKLVADAVVGHEWMDYDKYFALSESLFQKGQLA
jgi:hypothetical protein